MATILPFKAFRPAKGKESLVAAPPYDVLSSMEAKALTKDNPYSDNKELLIIPDAVHTDLYDRMDVIPFDKIEEFLRKAMD